MTNSRAIQFSHDSSLPNSKTHHPPRCGKQNTHSTATQKTRQPKSFNKLIVHILDIYCPATTKTSDYHL